MRLSVRERQVLGGGGALALALLLYALVWDPFQKELHRLRETVAQQRADLAWMRQAAADLKRLEETAPVSRTTRRRDGRSLLTLVDETARGAGLGQAVKRVEPQSGDQVRVRLEQVVFDDMIRWLGGLEQEHGVQTVDAVVDRQAAGGRVDARLTLRGRRP